MFSLVYGLSNASIRGWGSLGTLAPIAAAAVLLACFGIIESRTAEPLMPLRILSNRNRAGAYAMMLCVGTAAFSMFFFLTQFLQNILGWSPIRAGAGFLPLTAGVIIAASLASRFAGRIGIRVPLLIGAGDMLTGLAWLSRLTVTSGYADILGPLLLISVGIGLQFVPLTLTAVRRVHPSETGLASALLNTSQQLGGALGLSVLVTVAINAAKSRSQSLTAAAHGHATALTSAIAATHGYTTAFEVTAAIALAGFLISLIVIRAPRSAEATAPDGSQPHIDRRSPRPLAGAAGPRTTATRNRPSQTPCPECP
jgi:predicted MFS family arabinose efflux permease